MPPFAWTEFALASNPPRRDSGSPGRSRNYREFWDGPKPVGAGIERVMKHLDAPAPTVVTSVFSDWEEIVGEVIAAHARPQRIAKGELVLEVDDPAWASEMEWLVEEIVRRIRTSVETEEITSVKVILSR